MCPLTFSTETCVQKFNASVPRDPFYTGGLNLTLFILICLFKLCYSNSVSKVK